MYNYACYTCCKKPAVHGPLFSLDYKQFFNICKKAMK